MKRIHYCPDKFKNDQCDSELVCLLLKHTSRPACLRRQTGVSEESYNLTGQQ